MPKAVWLLDNAADCGRGAAGHSRSTCGAQVGRVCGLTHGVASPGKQRLEACRGKEAQEGRCRVRGCGELAGSTRNKQSSQTNGAAAGGCAVGKQGGPMECGVWV